jgi:hypothetical protein
VYASSSSTSGTEGLLAKAIAELKEIAGSNVDVSAASNQVGPPTRSNVILIAQKLFYFFI